MRAAHRPPPPCFERLTDDVVASGSETVAVLDPVDRRDAARAAPLERRRRARRGRPRPPRAAARGRGPGSPSAVACCCAAHDLLLERRELLLDLVQLESGKTRGQAFEEVFQAAAVTRYNALVGAAACCAAGAARGRGADSSSHDPRALPPEGRRRRHHAVELRAEPRGDGRHPRPRRRLRRRAEGRRPGRARRSSRCAARSSTPACPRRSGRSSPVRPSEVGEALTDDVDYICFTGSTATGRKIGEKAGRRLVGASLELGGKNAAPRARRRRPRAGRRGRRVRLLLGDGPAVRLDRAHLRRPEGRRAVPARPRRARSTRPKLGSALDYGDRLRLARERRAARARRGAPRRRGREGRDRARRRPRTDPTSVRGSSSRPCSPASRREMARLRRGDLRRHRAALPRRQRRGGRRSPRTRASTA